MTMTRLFVGVRSEKTNLNRIGDIPVGLMATPFVVGQVQSNR